MTEINNKIKARGDVQMIINYSCGKQEIIEFPNTVLNKGKEALAISLGNKFTGEFNYYINRMIFGTGGVAGGSLKYVDSSRNGLFCGSPVATKPVISALDPNVTSQVIFTSVLATSDAVGEVINEMALQMATGDLYSMVTFPNLTKTDQMSIIWNWTLSFI
jgi:hypothetical protein